MNCMALTLKLIQRCLSVLFMSHNIDHNMNVTLWSYFVMKYINLGQHELSLNHWRYHTHTCYPWVLMPQSQFILHLI